MTGMYVHEGGAPGAPAVVFLHGTGSSGRMWRHHVAKLEDRFHCLAPDLPGFGRSNRLAPASLDESADLIARLVETRVPAQRAHVVGLSWGGGIVHTLLEHHAGLIDRAVVDGAGVLPWNGGWMVQLGVTVISPFLHTAPVIALFSNMIGMDEVGRDELRASSRRAFRASFVEGFGKPRAPRVEVGVPCPTLLVAGEKESLIRPSNAALAAVMPHAVARYAPGVPHGWLARLPELHVRMVEAWLTGQELPAELGVEPPSPAAVERLRGLVGTRPGRGSNRPAARAR